IYKSYINPFFISFKDQILILNTLQLFQAEIIIFNIITLEEIIFIPVIIFLINTFEFLYFSQLYNFIFLYLLKVFNLKLYRLNIY
ncbi:hypothetical protein BO94DRAFT_480605, partial [Aspergillus sclerotioniger CBS 115572]